MEVEVLNCLPLSFKLHFKAKQAGTHVLLASRAVVVCFFSSTLLHVTPARSWETNCQLIGFFVQSLWQFLLPQWPTVAQAPSCMMANPSVAHTTFPSFVHIPSLAHMHTYFPLTCAHAHLLSRHLRTHTLPFPQQSNDQHAKIII